MVSYHQKNSTWALILKINTFFIKCVEYKHRIIFNIKEKNKLGTEHKCKKIKRSII